MKKFFYVDTENVGIQILLNLCNEDKDWNNIILYTLKSGKVPFNMMEKIVNSTSKFTFKECTNGTPNALDFCLCAEVGVTVKKNPRSLHIIISNDHGYDSMIQYLQAQGKRIVRVATSYSNSVSGLSSKLDITIGEMKRIVNSIQAGYESQILANENIQVKEITPVNNSEVSVTSDRATVIIPEISSIPVVKEDVHTLIEEHSQKKDLAKKTEEVMLSVLKGYAFGKTGNTISSEFQKVIKNALDIDNQTFLWNPLETKLKNKLKKSKSIENFEKIFSAKMADINIKLVV